MIKVSIKWKDLGIGSNTKPLTSWIRNIAMQLAISQALIGYHCYLTLVSQCLGGSKRATG